MEPKDSYYVNILHTLSSACISFVVVYSLQFYE